jgi:transcription elongation factor GreA-like protein
MNNFKISYEPIADLYTLHNRGVVTSFDNVVVDEISATLSCYGNHQCTVFEPAFTSFVEQLKNFDVNVEVVILKRIAELEKELNIKNADINRLELISEDIESAHIWLDDQGIPRHDVNNAEYSLVGRILRYKEQS